MSAPDAAPYPSSPPARKSRRNVPDLRLVFGLLLVVGSVVGVLGIVAVADRRVTVYAATSTLTPGERIDRGDLVNGPLRSTGPTGCI